VGSGVTEEVLEHRVEPVMDRRLSLPDASFIVQPEAEATPLVAQPLVGPAGRCYWASGEDLLEHRR
jgi:hypothetical protein